MNIPNQLTLLRILAIPAMIVFFAIGTPWAWVVAGILFALAAATDFLDGHLARLLHQVSNFGKLIDPLADKLLVAVACLVCSATVANDGAVLLSVWVTMLLICRELTISSLRAVVAQQGQAIASDWSGKIKTIIQDVGLPFLIIGHGGLPRLFGLDTVLIGRWLMYLSAVLSLYSLIVFLVKNWAVLRRSIQ